MNPTDLSWLDSLFLWAGLIVVVVALILFYKKTRGGE